MASLNDYFVQHLGRQATQDELSYFDKFISRGDLSAAEIRTWFENHGPQQLTAHNAVASTWGMRGEEYAPAVES